MILPICLKIGPVKAEISNEVGDSNHLKATAADFEYTRKCWEELKSYVDKILEEEINRSSSNISQSAKTKLAILVLDGLTKRAVDENLLIKELVKTGKFSTEEAGTFLKEAITEGIVYRDEDGFYAIH
jgi:hypothetical protein